MDDLPQNGEAERPEAPQPQAPPVSPPPRQYYVPYQPPPRKSGTSIWTVLIGFVLGVILIALAFEFFGDIDDTIHSADVQVGVVNLIGPIEDTTLVVEDLEEFRKDKTIDAVVLRIDSPGGSVGASQEVYREVERVKELKPVVVSMGSLAASGGYYSAASASMIVANPGTLTGSIGVIVTSTYMRDLIEYLKMDPVVYKSGKHKDILSPFRRATEDDEALIHALIQDIYTQFLDDIAKGRNVPVEDIRKIADGRIFTGKEALEYKLVDKTGNMMDAAREAGVLAGFAPEAKLELVYPEEDKFKTFEKLFEGAAKAVMRAASGSSAKIETRMNP